MILSDKFLKYKQTISRGLFYCIILAFSFQHTATIAATVSKPLHGISSEMWLLVQSHNLTRTPPFMDRITEPSHIPTSVIDSRHSGPNKQFPHSDETREIGEQTAVLLCLSICEWVTVQPFADYGNGL
jgi:hypothetical protein